MTRGRFPVLVATDGSAPARAMVETAVGFPWPRGARASGVVAGNGWLSTGEPSAVHDILERTLAATAREAEAALGRRWRGARVDLVPGPPAEGILRQAQRRGARVLVVGSSGRGRLDRLVIGSVSAALARRAHCAVLVAKGRRRTVRRLVLGFDGSPNAWRAVDLVAKLAVPAGNRVTLVRMVAPERTPAGGLMPPAGRRILEERAAALNAEGLRRARAETARAAARLARRGWKVRVDVRLGSAAPALLAATATADLLVVGARGAGGLRGLLIGSVADSVLHRSPASVLIVR